MSTCFMCGKGEDVDSKGYCIDCSKLIRLPKTRRVYYCKTCHAEIDSERAFCDQHRPGEIIKVTGFMVVGMVIFTVLKLTVGLKGILSGFAGTLLLLLPFIGALLYRKDRFEPDNYADVEIKDEETVSR